MSARSSFSGDRVVTAMVSPMRRKLVVGNWKMNGHRAANAQLLAQLMEARPFVAEVAVCVPFPYLGETAATLAASELRWGAQDCSAEADGAFTGEVSAAMLADCGCRWTLVGHSERRARHQESDELVARKAQASLARGITPIVCVGETLQQRDAGQTDEVVKRQLSAVIHQLAHCAGEIVVAEQAQQVHAVLRAQLQAATGHAARMRILYGGSVKADNAATLFAMPDIDGGLIGGASLKAADFIAICRAAG